MIGASTGRGLSGPSQSVVTGTLTVCVWVVACVRGGRFPSGGWVLAELTPASCHPTRGRRGAASLARTSRVVHGSAEGLVADASEPLPSKHGRANHRRRIRSPEELASRTRRRPGRRAGVDPRPGVVGGRPPARACLAATTRTLAPGRRPRRRQQPAPPHPADQRPPELDFLRTELESLIAEVVAAGDGHEHEPSS